MMHPDQTVAAPGQNNAHSETQNEALLRGEIKTLQKRLDARFREIAALTDLARTAQDKAELELTPLRTRVAELEHHAALTDRRHHVEAQLSRIGPRIWAGGHGPDVPPLDRQTEALGASDLFDADWYLETYPDLAGSGIAPAEHYLRAGSFEGRNPGPNFDTMGYYMANPDILPSGWPALAHYVMFGAAEGRSLAFAAPGDPATQTDASQIEARETNAGATDAA